MSTSIIEISGDETMVATCKGCGAEDASVSVAECSDGVDYSITYCEGCGRIDTDPFTDELIALIRDEVEYSGLLLDVDEWERRMKAERS